MKTVCKKKHIGGIAIKITIASIAVSLLVAASMTGCLSVKSIYKTTDNEAADLESTATPTSEAMQTFVETRPSDSTPSSTDETTPGTTVTPTPKAASTVTPKPTARPTATATPKPTATATPKPMATPTKAPSELTRSEWISALVRLTNEARANNGIGSLSTSDSALRQAAQVRANEICSVYSHTRPDGSEWFTVLSDEGVVYKTAGENIAWGTLDAYTPEDIIKGWMDSPGHRANILNSDFTLIGVGYAEANGKAYFVQLFAG